VKNHPSEELSLAFSNESNGKGDEGRDIFHLQKKLRIFRMPFDLAASVELQIIGVGMVSFEL
jgi:hypothetical protein